MLPTLAEIVPLLTAAAELHEKILKFARGEIGAADVREHAAKSIALLDVANARVQARIDEYAAKLEKDRDLMPTPLPGLPPVGDDRPGGEE